MCDKLNEHSMQTLLIPNQNKLFMNQSSHIHSVYLHAHLTGFILGTSGGSFFPKNSKFSPKKILQSIRLHEEIDR